MIDWGPKKMMDKSLVLLLAVMVGMVYSIPVTLKDKKHGLAVQKTEQHHSEVINGHVQNEQKSSKTLSDPESGKVIAAAEKTKTKSDGEPAQEHTKIDIPSENIHIDENMVSPEEIAAYIFETSDYEGVKDTIQKMVEEKQIDRTTAEEYMERVNEVLHDMHVKAFEKLEKELDASHKEDEHMYDAMLTLTEKLNEDAKILQAIQDFSQALFLKYKNDDDGYAKKLLVKFGKSLEEAKDAGKIEESVQAEVLAKIMKGVRQLETETGSDETESELENLQH